MAFLTYMIYPKKLDILNTSTQSYLEFHGRDTIVFVNTHFMLCSKVSDEFPSKHSLPSVYFSTIFRFPSLRSSSKASSPPKTRRCTAHGPVRKPSKQIVVSLERLG